MAITDTSALLINRPTLLDSVRKAFQSGQHVLLSGKRGMGKTVLVQQFASEISGSKSLPILRLDLTDVMVEVDLIRALAYACISNVDTGQVKVMKDFASAFTYLRPVVRYDGFSANPSVEFSIDEDIRYDITIDQLLGYASRVVNPKLMVIEHIERIVEPAVRNAFRDALQKNMRCKVCLTTSDGQLSATLSANGTWPFDAQTQQVRVEPIDDQQFATDLQELMTRHRKKLEAAAAERLSGAEEKWRPHWL
jgi:ribosome-binding factor A